ncbi:MAG TPA: hypothetical protein VMI52_07790 [Acetobacteraceae bacterium]|nr:hypothetical protein [Acetobacteraceae bacterium]
MKAPEEIPEMELCAGSALIWGNACPFASIPAAPIKSKPTARYESKERKARFMAAHRSSTDMYDHDITSCLMPGMNPSFGRDNQKVLFVSRIDIAPTVPAD